MIEGEPWWIKWLAIGAVLALIAAALIWGLKGFLLVLGILGALVLVGISAPQLKRTWQNFRTAKMMEKKRIQELEDRIWRPQEKIEETQLQLRKQPTDSAPKE